ncbi:MAG: Asp-tRNA(Asn)/Glu-tRNA(Gln) amidotransferase subunit GatB [Oscillospiraceae bacterium]|nr:Asp-tRNA(Asn)/Glu-tRNA(Gln) amidotransferase subunit GatB [Oscillospiraceae bacterium]
MNPKYETVIGLEIHAELSTKTKAFCACEYSFGGEVNTQWCPGCVGMPGTLPTLNKMVVEYALRLGLATDCKVNQRSGHDRKQYFYPDLAKGYQVTQADAPICEGGKVEFYHKGEKRSVRLTRIHIEEDTAKLLHGDAFAGTLLDFNRSGVPLLEIVSEPDLRSAEETKDYLEAVRMLLGTLDICNCQMQEGTIRCDVNVSVRPIGQTAYGTRVEMKNVNTFSGAMQAVTYEANRQIELIEAGIAFPQETRRWDEHSGVSISMRTKENAADYRYFPEADLFSLSVSDAWIADVKQSLPELPVAKYERYRGMGVSEGESWLLVESPEKEAYFEACMQIGGVSPKNAANWIFGLLTARWKETGVSPQESSVTPVRLCEMLRLIESGTISNDAGKTVLDALFASDETAAEIVARLSLAQVSDVGELKALVTGILEANEDSVTAYKNGKSNAFGFLVGQCMKASQGKANPQILNQLLRELLD